MKKLSYLLILLLALSFAACSDDDDDNPVTTTTYKISGTISVPSGSGLPGASVILSGAKSETKTTDSNGKYEFTELEAGDYIVTVTSADYDFEESSVSITSLSDDEVIDFSAKEGIVGTWVSAGDNIAPLLQQIFANTIDSIYATFSSNQVYSVKQVQIDASTIAYEGTYTVQKSSVGNIYTISIGQTSPTVATVEGIYEIDRTQNPHFMNYEVVQTDPPAGTSATPEAGFGSTSGGVLGETNVQKYIRLN